MNKLFILEPLYSENTFLKIIEHKIKHFENQLIISRKIKKYNDKNNNLQISSFDKIVLENFKNINTIPIENSDYYNVELKKKSIKIIDQIFNKKFYFEGIDLIPILKYEAVWEVYNLLNKYNSYQNLIKKQNNPYVFIEEKYSLDGKILKTICEKNNLNYGYILPSPLSKIKSFFINLKKHDSFKSLFNDIGIYKIKNIHDNNSKKILIDANYINYLRNIIIVINKFFKEKNFEIYLFSKKTDLVSLNIEYEIYKKLKPQSNDDLGKILNNIFLNRQNVQNDILLSLIRDEMLFSMKEKLPYLLLKLKASKDIISEINPNIVIVGDDRSTITRVSILPAKKRNIPILEVQHGSYFKEDVFLRKAISDKICVWGEFYKNVMEGYGSSKEQIELTGCPQFDNIRFCNNENSSNNKIILFATQPPFKYLNLKIIEEIGSNIPDKIQLLVKPHPSENEDYYKFLEKKFPNKVLIKSRDENISELLIKSDLLIMINSTVGMEAALYNKPILTVKADEKSIYVSEGIAINVNNLNDLIPAITNILYNQNLLEKIAQKREKFLFEHTYLKDGLASERVAKVINNLIK